MDDYNKKRDNEDDDLIFEKDEKKSDFITSPAGVAIIANTILTMC